MRYDCAIIGAGPAGASAAYHLARRGHSVLLLEKAALPRYKPCGGGVSPQVAQWFDFDFSPAISLKLDQVRYTWQMGEAIEAKLNVQAPVWMVRREVFDQFLVKQAQGRGAEVCDRTPVTGLTNRGDQWQIHTDQGDFASRYVIAADGGKGPTAGWLGFKTRRRKLAIALEAEAYSPISHPPLLHLEMGLVKQGYLWNFPKADGQSIGIGVFPGGKSQGLKQCLQTYGQSFGLDLTQWPTAIHPLSVWQGKQRLHTERALLAGEAACLVDPFTAEGIRPSMYSGVQAAIAIHDALNGNPDALPHYSQHIHDGWGADLAWADRIAKLFYALPRLGYRLMGHPRATPIMLQIFCGEKRYRDVAHRALQRLTGQ